MSVIINGISPLGYAEKACETLMRKFQPDQLPPVGRFHYHQGVFLSGMQNTYRLTGNRKYFDYIKGWVDSIIWEDGSIHQFDPGQMDDIQPAILLFQLYKETKDERYTKALATLIDAMDKYPKCKCGGFWHKSHLPYQMWLDGLYMGGPLLAEYGATFNKPEYLEIPVFQIQMMEKNTKDPKTGLWYHAWDESREASWADKETGLSPEFWGRSIGWVPIAILDVLQFLPKDHPQRGDLERIIRELMTAVAKYQDEETGLWYQVVDKGGMEGNWLESSCTCLYAAAIKRAVEAGIMDKSFLPVAEKGYTGIINRLKEDEKGLIIDNVCVGTGVGGYKHYCDRPTSANDLHGVGAFLLMCTAME